MKRHIILFAIFVALVPSGLSSAFEIEKSPLYVYLHEVKPIEEEAAKALKDEDYALALRRYKEALRKYEGIWKDYPDLANQRPYGIDRMVDDSIETCRKVIEEIKEQGEAQDEFYQKLSAPVRISFTDKHIREVAKALTFLTDVNIIIDEAALTSSSPTLNPTVTIKTQEPWPLRTILARLCRQTGLAFSIEDDHVFISTRVKLDKVK
jgi:hypothetical protein